MDTLRTLGGFGSGKALFRAVGIKVQDPIMPDGVVAAGYLSILHASKTVANAQQRQAWKRRYFVLRSTGQLDYYKSGRYGVGTNAKGGALLSAEPKRKAPIVNALPEGDAPIDLAASGPLAVSSVDDVRIEAQHSASR